MIRSTVVLVLVVVICVKSNVALPNKRNGRNNDIQTVNATLEQLFPSTHNAGSRNNGPDYGTVEDPIPVTQSSSGKGGRRPCETEQIEYRLTKLEVQVAEKGENLRSELREGNRRLQALEYQSAEAQTALEGFRNELGRFTEGNQPLPQRYSGESFQPHQQEHLRRLETRVDNLARGIQLVVAALRGISYDSGWVKRNVSALANSTQQLMNLYENLVSKQFLSNSLIDLKHNQNMMLFPPQQLLEKQANVKCPPKSCKDVKDSGKVLTGIYKIQPENAPRPFMALCDMGTRGGGWTVIHNRFEGSQDFYLDWHNYKYGFGNIGGEFWLGLENIHHLTEHDVNELLIELEDDKGEAYAYYTAFSIGAEVEGYPLKVLAGYNGTAGDSLTYHAGSRFSTKDMDQDGWPEGSCAQSHSGAWWYRGCDTSNLNGRYLNGELPESYLYQGMYWGEFRGAQYSLSQARMMVRPRSETSPPIFPEGIAGSRD